VAGGAILLLLARGDAVLLGEPRRAVGLILGDGHDHRGEEKRVLTPFLTPFPSEQTRHTTCNINRLEAEAWSKTEQEKGDVLRRLLFLFV